MIQEPAKPTPAESHGPLPPGRATEDYASESQAPFKPLITAASLEPQPAPKPPSRIPWLVGLATAVVVIVAGYFLLF